jgi:hypothetical protein
LSQPSGYCEAWKEEVYDNPATLKEYKAFKNGPEITKVIESVTHRLGFTSRISYGTYALFDSIAT